jgi:chemotaxis protein methyltransferase CheR
MKLPTIMYITDQHTISKEKLSDADFKRLSEFIYKNYGIKMPNEKRTMLEGRLMKRLRAHQIKSFAEYCDYVFSPEGMEKEVIHMINVVSTNKTDFFREPTHFEFLYDTVLPEFHQENKGEQIKVWSSASSSGEEPYTIAMAISEFARQLGSPFPYHVLGTDISSDILEKAQLGIYKDERIRDLPRTYKKRYFMANRDPQKKLVRVVPELRRNASFMRVNLMDTTYAINEKFHVIFCRNVLIYFDRPTQEAVINKLCNHLVPGGYFFLGHSESATGMQVPLTPLKPTIFRRK